MAKPTRPTRPTQPIAQQRFEDEIDLMELIHFIVKGARWWMGGGLIFTLLALLYALTLYPSTYRQQTINDIGLTQKSLSLIRQMMPAMTTPLKGSMQTQGLDSLYQRLTKGSGYLEKTILGLSGADLKDKTLDQETKAKIDTVRILVKGKDPQLMQREVSFIRNHLRGASQYLAVKRYLDDQVREAKLNLFNTESQVNRQRLSYERAERQLRSYQALQQEPHNARDLQIILNLSNQEETVDDFAGQNDISEFTGAKYLPLGNRIVALKSEMADQLEAVHIAQQQIEALKLSQRVLSELESTFNRTEFQGDAIDFAPMLEVVHNFRLQLEGGDSTREKIAALDNLERNLISFERNGLKFNNTLPAVVEQPGKVKVVVIGGLLGGVFGFLYYGWQTVRASYRRRYLT